MSQLTASSSRKAMAPVITILGNPENPGRPARMTEERFFYR